MVPHPPAAPPRTPSREAAPPSYTAPPSGAWRADRQLSGAGVSSSQATGQRQLNSAALHSARLAQQPLDGAAAGGARPRLGWLQRLREPAPSSPLPQPAPADAASSAGSGRVSPTVPSVRPPRPAPGNAANSSARLKREALAEPQPAPANAASSTGSGGAAPAAAQPAAVRTTSTSGAGRLAAAAPRPALGAASTRRQPRPWDSHLTSPSAAAAPDRPPDQWHPGRPAPPGPAAPAPRGAADRADAAQLATRTQPHAESVLPAAGPYGPVPVYGRSVESILAAVAAERRSDQGLGEGLDALPGLQGPGTGDVDDALDLAFNQLPRWSLRGDSHAFDWSGATNYTALHLQVRRARKSDRRVQGAEGWHGCDVALGLGGASHALRLDPPHCICRRVFYGGCKHRHSFALCQIHLLSVHTSCWHRAVMLAASHGVWFKHFCTSFLMPALCGLAMHSQAQAESSLRPR